MTLPRLTIFLSLSLSAALWGGDRDFLMSPLKVRGDRQGERLAAPGEEIPTNYLPSAFRVLVPASSATEAWNRMAPQFDDTLRPLGLEPLADQDLGELRSIPGAHRLKDDRLYRCKNPGAMERLRHHLLFVNQKKETRGWIRQILVGVGPIPESGFRGSTTKGWQDEIGLRVYIVGTPEGSASGEDLPFDVTPLIQDLAAKLEASVR